MKLQRNEKMWLWIGVCVFAAIFVWQTAYTAKAVHKRENVTATIALGTGRSVTCDTIALDAMLGNNLLAAQYYSGLYAKIILDPNVTSSGHGLALADSGYLRLWAGFSVKGVMTFFTLGQDSVASLPCTLDYVRSAQTAGADTLFKENLYLVWQVSDSTSDTAATVLHPLYLDYILFDK